jgi:uncharacterized protein YdeI (YjbR/CyaY-like superfamily)
MNSGQPPLAFASQNEWEAWLDVNHATANEVWVKFAKKGSGVDSVTVDEAQESALCFGWIDGRAASIDERFWMMRFTPRRPKSTWSAINRERVARLAAEGRLRPAGLREVEAAKHDGRWGE